MADVCTIYVNEIKILFIQLDFMKRTLLTNISCVSKGGKLTRLRMQRSILGSRFIPLIAEKTHCSNRGN